MKNILLLITFAFYFISNSNAQIQITDSTVFAPLFNLAYTYQVPSGELANRFGNNSNISFSVLIKDKKNFLYGVGASFLVGKDIKEQSIIDGITDNNGTFFDEDGAEAEVRIFERGFTAMVYGGKLFPILSPNPNSGFYILAGLGFMQHKIKYDDIVGNVPQLAKEYIKGYDRLTNGLAISEAIGYRFMSNNRLTNFFIELEVIQGFTKNRRVYNFDTMEKDDHQRLDILMGVKLGWTFPAYKRMPRTYYYN